MNLNVLGITSFLLFLFNQSSTEGKTLKNNFKESITKKGKNVYNSKSRIHFMLSLDNIICLLFCQGFLKIADHKQIPQTQLRTYYKYLI